MHLNKLIKILIISDFFLITGFGLIQPLLAVFINENISNSTLFTIGIASGIFLITKSLIQVPFSLHVDKYDDENDLSWLIVGTVLITTTPLIYIFSTSIFHIFFAQFIYGIGAGLAYPAWLGLWSTHLDKNRESFEWSFYSALTGIGSALAGGIGGLLIQNIGFKPTFVVVSLLSLLACLSLIILKIKFKNINPKNDYTPTKILSFPELRQTYNYDCGAKATEAVLAFFGLDIREDIIMKKAKTNEKIGTPIKGVVKTLKSYGLKCKVGRFKIHHIKNYIEKGLPVILVLQAWTNKKNVNWEKDWVDGHYVVAIGYDDKHIYFEDPSSVLRTYLTYEELKKRWHDVDADGKKYFNFGIVAFGKSPAYNLNIGVHMD